MFEPSGSMGVSFTWCNCPPRLKTWLTFVFQEGKSWEAALERTRSHLCLTWNLFLVGAARPGSYWRTLVPLSQWPSKHLSLFPTLPALVWGLMVYVQVCLVPWEGQSCKGCHRRSLAITLGKFHSLPCAPWSSRQHRAEMMSITVSCLMDKLRNFIPVLMCFSRVIRSLR